MMARETNLLRVLLMLLLFGAVLAGGLLYIVSLDLADTYPQMAYLRVPIYIAVLAGLGPIVLAAKVTFDLLGIIDRGEAFSPGTLKLLRRLKRLAGITAAYELLGFLGIWAAAWATLGQTKAYLLLPWFAAEAATLFVFTLLSLLERLFCAALELRRDTELTV